MGQKPNQLLTAASPYLRQHAYNPIDWYPWGEEAIAKAKRENKPIFLSVGYSTCHWCHVMEKESFSQKDIGAILNKYFVAIKVDRERRPDLDERYMLATQIMTGTGGWPNNLFLTPDQKPFYAGGYFSKKDFAQILHAVQSQWNSPNRSKIVADGDKLEAMIHKVMNRQEQAQQIDEKAIKKASHTILEQLDPFNGGFSVAPKFPEEPKLMFLSRMALQYNDKEALKALRLTVDAILDGGIHDHVGGGFHRYAIDNDWLVPHFEKMLYTQAQMVRVLVRLYQLTGEDRYKTAAKRCLDFVLRDMTSPEGGFYSAYDADSKGGEGRYYTWSIEEVRKVLPAKDADFALSVFGISKGGNFEGFNILHYPGGLKEGQGKTKLSKYDFFNRIEKIRHILLKARNKRQKPHLDKKIIASWNGLMITAFAESGMIFRDEKYKRAAQKAYFYIEDHMKDAKGEVLRTSYMGKASLSGQLSDYAALGLAGLSLYDAAPTFKQGAKWKKSGLVNLAKIETLFLDKKQGGYFMTKAHKLKKRDDSALPSGNALMLEALTMLSERTNDPVIQQKASALLSSMSGLMVKVPVAMPSALRAADMHLRGENMGHVGYGGRGHIKASIQSRWKIAGMGAESYTALKLAIEEGWHINANKPLEDFLLPTTISLDSRMLKDPKFKVVFPKAIHRKLGFNSNKKMALYEGSLDFRFPARLKQGHKIIPITINFQACSDKICLEPDQIKIFMEILYHRNTF